MPINVPTDIPGCMLWLDASATNVFFEDTTGTTTPTQYGQPIGYWKDLSLSNNNFTSLTGGPTTRPLLTTSSSNLSGVWFDGINDYLFGAVTGFRYLTGGATIFCVCEPLSAAAADWASASFWGFGNVGGGSGIYPASKAIILASSTTAAGINGEYITLLYESQSHAGGRLASSTYRRANKTREVLVTSLGTAGTSLIQNTGVISLNLNNSITTTTNTAPSSTSVATSNYTIDDNVTLNGARSNGVLAGGPENIWHEFIIYNKQLTSLERYQVETYLTKKWNTPEHVYAINDGNFTAASTWLDNNLPTVASNIHSNNKRVTIDTDITALSLCNNRVFNSTGAPSSGGYEVYEPVTLTLLGDGIVPGSMTAVTCFTGGTDTLTVIGTVRGGTASGSYGIFNSEAGTVRCITTQGVIGNTGICIYNSSAGAVYVIGPVYGAATASNGYGIYNAISGYINVVGNIYGGNGSNSHGVYLEPITDLTGALRVTGDIYAGSQSNGIAGANFWADIQLNSKFTADRVNGRQAVTLQKFLLNPKPYASYTRFAVNASQLVGYSAVDDYSIYLHPEAKDVQLGVTYGALTLSGIPVQLVGTMGVPDRAAVSYGTPVSNTLGVGIVSVESLRSAWTIPIVNMKIKDTIGRRTVATATIPEFGELLRKINV
jgi:hypothetical protein